MSSPEDESQQTTAPEASSSAPLEGAETTVPLSDSAAEDTSAANAEGGTNADDGTTVLEGAPDATASTEDANKKPRSASERLKSRTREGRPRKKRGGFIALLVMVLLLLGIIGSAVGGFAYLYWFANDDALDFEGTWYVAGTETPIEITADTIRLTDSVAYHYKLNTQDKTIALTLGNMTGYGSYRFSLDRSQLVIFDGQADPQAVLETDIRWLVKAWFDELQNKQNDVTSGIRRNRTLLTREPGALPISENGSSSSSQTPDSSVPSDEPEEPQTVWSAEEWLNSSEENGSASDSSGGSYSSDVNDVNSLLEGINDLPAPATDPAADGVGAPQDSSS